MPSSAAIPYLFLGLSIFLSRVTSRVWFYFFAFAAVFAWSTGRIGFVPVIAFGTLAGFGELYDRKVFRLGWLWALCAGLVSGLIFLRLLPGFNNLNIFKGFVGSETALPYSLWLNFDKPVVGLILAYYFCKRKIVNLKNLSSILLSTFKICLLSCLVVYPLAWGLGYVGWEPKIPEILWWWIPINLLGTCLAEEALFRGLLQDKLLGPILRQPFSILVAALAFGASHFAGGWKYVALASVAGIFYGWAYEKGGKSLDAAVLCHFGLNLGHLLLLTYPSLPL